MASTDWTALSNGFGVYSIIADGTAPSPPDIMQVTQGGQFFENITGGPFKDSRISAWMRTSITGLPLLLALRSLDDTTYEVAPASYFRTKIRAESANMVDVTIEAVVNGVLTVIVASTDVISVNGNTVGTWQQYQFSAFNSGTDILLRVSQWNGSAFVPIVDAAAPIATFPTLDAAGNARFGAEPGFSGTVNIDDVNYYSLT